MLVDAGADVNAVDGDEQTPLCLAMKAGQCHIAQVLLQCGALTNVYYRNRTLADWLDHREQPQNSSAWFQNGEQLRQVFRKYGPGLVHQVRHGLFDQLRVSLNFWCRTDVTDVNGKTLLDISIEEGCDDVTRLLTRVSPYMKLVHHVLAQDLSAVDAWYCSQKSLQCYPIFYASDDGFVPLLYFAIQYMNAELISGLISHGHRTTFPIANEAKGDKAVLFSALKRHVPLAVLQALLRDLHDHDDQLHLLFWRDCNVLQVALFNECPPEVIRLLLAAGNCFSFRPVNPP